MCPCFMLLNHVPGSLHNCETALFLTYIRGWKIGTMVSSMWSFVFRTTMFAIHLPKHQLLRGGNGLAPLTPFWKAVPFFFMFFHYFPSTTWKTIIQRSQAWYFWSLALATLPKHKKCRSGTAARRPSRTCGHSPFKLHWNEFLFHTHFLSEMTSKFNKIYRAFKKPINIYKPTNPYLS